MQDKRSIKSIIMGGIALTLIAVGAYLIVTKAWQRTNPEELDSIDLTTMNSTMVYAYVNDMVNNSPQDYLGKTIKAGGMLNKSFYAGTQKYYYYVVISDATECCVQGIEFIYGGEYPEENAEIIVLGTFESYNEQGKTYYYINVTQLNVV